MESTCGLILALSLVICIFFTGCVTENTPAPGPVGGSSPQDGVLIQTIGDVTGQGVILQGVPRGTVDTITFAIGLAPNVKSVDMNNLTIAYADAVRTEILKPVEGYRAPPPPGDWGILSVENEAGSPNMRLEYDEQFIIRINPKAAIVPNQVITLSVKPGEGKPLIMRRVVPSTIFENDNILPVL
jgi:archaellin